MRVVEMKHGGACHQVVYIRPHVECGTKLPSSNLMEEKSKDEENITEAESIFLPEFKKRKHCHKEVKAELCEMQSGGNHKIKKNGNIDRWSADRYKLAEKMMWEVLKDAGATFENRITRPALRMAARKHIGDTGLLDHLLKHIDGQVAPGGTERFRRWFNTKGIMEYWLESANLDKIRKEAGVLDPYWRPPSTFRAGSVLSQNDDSIEELKMLQREMAQMKKDMQELIAKKQEKSEISLKEEEETHKELVKWKAMTDQHLTELMTSLKGVQGMCDDILIWKTKVEQQLMEITNKLSGVQASPPSLRWEDWLVSTNPELLNVSQKIVVEDPNSTRPIQPLNEEQTILKKRNLAELVPIKQEEDQPYVTPNYFTTVNSKSSTDNSLISSQGMFMELLRWKDKMEHQLLEVSNTVYGMVAIKRNIGF